jgi:chromosome segregation ATPase
MKQEEQSVLMIFQDPLINMVSLILLTTLFMIVPSRETGSNVEESIPKLQRENGMLREALNSYDGRIKDIQNSIERMITQLPFLQASEKEARNKSEESVRLVARLLEETASVRSVIRDKQEELSRLEKELKEAKESASRQATAANELDRNIKRLKDELAAKEASLRDLERQLDSANKDLGQRKAKQEEQKKIVQEHQRVLAGEKAEVSKLESEKGGLEESLRTMPGFGAYSVVNNKEALVFDTIDNRILQINEKNYDVEVARTMENNQVTGIVKVTKKKSASGETAEKIADPNSEFQKQLKAHDKAKYYLVFEVHKDSFALFRKARELAWKKGFQVDWDPRDDGPLYGSSSPSSGGKRFVR